MQMPLSSFSEPELLDFDESISHACHISMSYESVQWPVLPEVIDSHNHHNEILLNVVLNNHDQVARMDHEDVDYRESIILLESKVNLMMHWMATLIAKDKMIPPRQPLSINTIGIRFPIFKQAASGQYLKIELYVDQQIPQPITCYVVLQKVELESEGYVATGTFVGMDSAVHNLIDKYVFKQHRHFIAKHKTLRTS